MKGGRDDVGRALPRHLYQELAQVGFDDLDAVVFQRRVELNLLGRHRLAFDHHLDFVVVQDLKHRCDRSGGVRGRVYDRADRLGRGREILDQFRHAVEGGLATSAQVGLAAREVASAESRVATLAQLRQGAAQGHRQRLRFQRLAEPVLKRRIACAALPAAISASSLAVQRAHGRAYQGMRW